MAKPSIDRPKAAKALSEWGMKHFKRAFASSIAENYKITERTLWNWKSALERDHELSALYEEHLNALYSADWVGTLDKANGAYLMRLLELAPTATQEEARETFKVLAEMKLTKEVLTSDVITNAKSNTIQPREISQAEAPSFN
jgi:hypothetical protein